MPRPGLIGAPNRPSTAMLQFHDFGRFPQGNALHLAFFLTKSSMWSQFNLGQASASEGKR
jgi:hypothetical protein